MRVVANNRDATVTYPPGLMTEEAEAAMLSMLLLDNRRVDQVADLLLPEHFSEPLCGRIYQRAVELVSAGHAANPITLHPFFADDPAFVECGGMAMLAGLTGGSASAFMLIRARDQAEVIVEQAKRRRLIDITARIAASAADPDRALAELIDEVDAALIASVERREAPRQDHMSASIGKAIARIEAIQTNGGRVGAATGIDELDKLLGGLEAPEVTIIGARPGMGKTALACSAAVGLARNGHGVYFASLEMKSVELGMRMVSDLCCRGIGRWIPYASIVNGTASAAEIETLRAAEQAVRSWPLEIDDMASATVATLHRSVRRMKRKMAAKGQRLEVVIVDYLQLMHAEDRKASIYEAISEISKGLKGLAKDLDVSVVALAQLSRAVEQRDDKRPQLADLRDSGQIEQDADAVMFLYREEYYLARQKPKPGNEEAHEKARLGAAGKLTLICAKRRSGPIGSAEVQYLAPYQAVRPQYWGR